MKYNAIIIILLALTLTGCGQEQSQDEPAGYLRPNKRSIPCALVTGVAPGARLYLSIQNWNRGEHVKDIVW